MTSLVLILLCPTAGYLLRTLGKVPETAVAGVNAWVLYVALPATALLYLPSVAWGPESLVPLAMPLVVWLGAWIVLRVGASLAGLDRGRRTALLLTSGLGNTSFLGFPLLLAYFGPGALPTGILCDQATFLLLSTVGLSAALRFRNHGQVSLAKRNLWKRLLSVIAFPPFLASVAGVFLPLFADLSAARPILTALSATLAPLALFSVGLQLRFGDLRTEARSLAWGLGYKLVVAPALVLGLLLAVRVHGPVAQITVVEAAMAPMITAALVASDHGAGGRLANAMVGLGIPFSLVTVTGWWWLVAQILG